jgi:hypothetical protein
VAAAATGVLLVFFAEKGNITVYVLAVEDTDVETAIDREAVESYLGRYRNSALGEINLQLDGEALLMNAGEFSAHLRRRISEDDQPATYTVTDVPLTGTPVRLAKDESGAPILILGEGVTEYTFQKVE